MPPMTVVVFLVVFFGAFTIPQPALAYLDPASGSMILQLVLGGIAGTLVVLKLYWRRFMNLLSRRKRPDEESSSLG